MLGYASKAILAYATKRLCDSSCEASNTMKLSQDERRIYQFANNHDQTQYDQIETLLQRIGGDTFKITMKLLSENKLQSTHGVFN